ncbi:hypothetical protein KEM52_006707 [Ascosphaera acerosa]|nr:hypothetical protein KEM52_006707 [Ascosphaera acerosa]
MVYDIIRDSLFGQTVRWLTNNKYFLYPEEQPQFDLSTLHARLNHATPADSQATAVEELDAGSDGDEKGKCTQPAPTLPPTPISECWSEAVTPVVPVTARDDAIDEEEQSIGLREIAVAPPASSSSDSDEPSQSSDTQGSKPAASTPEKAKLPAPGEGAAAVVGWYSEDDPENPQNWSGWKKSILVALIFYYTFAVYGGSAIYTSSLDGVMERFGVSPVAAELGLSMYVLGYGIGPLIWAPMSEIPRFGRNGPYLSTFVIFFILSFPTAVANSFAGLVVLRFLQGFFGSPSLANGGATMHDLFSRKVLPYTMSIWVVATYAGPSIGPLMSGFAVTNKDWRWSLWEIVWMTAPAVILWVFLLPETSPDTILLRRAERLRRVTKNKNLRTAAELRHQHDSFRSIATDALIKPFEISIKDPAVAFVHTYTAIIYGIYYSFFESFPLVFPTVYGMSMGITGVLFMCLVPACLLGVTAYLIYVKLTERYEKRNGREPPPEHRLLPGLIAPFGQTAGLFLFAWTANERFHWIVPIMGVVTNSGSAFLNMQSVFMYLPVSYPQYAASLFGMNDFVRSAFAFGTIMFSRDMFLALGVARGVSLLGGLSVIGIVGMWLLYFYGAKLRARSRFAAS